MESAERVECDFSDLRPAVEGAGHRFPIRDSNTQTSAGYFFETHPERMQERIPETVGA